MAVTVREMVKVVRAQVADYRWRRVLNRNAVRRQRHHPLTLESVAGRRILRELQEKGIATFHLTALPEGADLLGRLTADYETELAGQGEEIAKRRHLLKTGGAAGEGGIYKTSLVTWYPTGVVPPYAHPLGRWALAHEILAIVNRYLGMYSQVLTLKYWYSVASAGQKADGSQLWHRDYNDRHLLKTFLYVGDVDEGTGPFSFAKGTHHGVLRDTDPPLSRDSTGARRVTDEDMECLVPGSDLVTAVGSAGSVVLADTSGFHKGGFATRRDRKMIVVTYKSSSCHDGMDHPIAGVPAKAHPAVRVAAGVEDP